jgi:hypothetical protein
MTLDPGCIAIVTLSLHCGVWTPASTRERVPDEF